MLLSSLVFLILTLVGNLYIELTGPKGSENY